MSEHYSLALKDIITIQIEAVKSVSRYTENFHIQFHDTISILRING